MKNNNIKLSLSIGFALFAMLFGAGNIIFPLYLGANIGENIYTSIIGFLLTGVGAPFLGLFSSSLFEGNYWKFFNKIGKIPAFIIITFLMIIIGPLIAIPRTEIVVFSNIYTYLPKILQNHYIFSFIYCLLILLLSKNELKILNILGLILSPLKIVTFSILIITGLLLSTNNITTLDNITPIQAFNKSILVGYSTMDLLATFFFSSVIFQSIKKNKNISLIINANIIGAILISIIYIFFILLSFKYKNYLINIPIENTLIEISKLILGNFGGVFVSFCLSIACLATALALTQVSKKYIHKEIFKKNISELKCLIIIITITFIMSHLKFQNIMKIILPFLEILYPSLIVICITNTLYKIKKINIIKLSTYSTFFISILFAIIHK